ncbi:MAG: hypothetical protein J6Q05_06510, partial [Elusimicrobiaceae bacterium]|nr:hypothetical protein [Elusimicrobiaceae bacterium]
AYAWLVCLAVPFTFLYLQIARCTQKRWPVSREVWVWYGILALLLCWSHYFGALLFGLFSVVLFVNAWRYKQSLRWFMIVPTAVLVLFLPWLIPNLIYNLTQHRFSGNWWGNQTSVSWHLLKLWVEFFFTSFKAFYVLLGLGILAVVYSGLRKRKIGGWPYAREIWLLFIPIAIAGIFVWVVSFKIFWLLWRYFMPFVPGLYLLVALVLSPVCKRYFMLFLVFLCFVGLSYNMFFHIRPLFWKNRFFPARGAMEIYKEAFDDKDLYVVALEAFPPESMVPMYSFYPNQYFNMHKKVYELFSMPADEREQLLSRHQTALLWMPNCTADKLNRVIQQWERPLEVFARYRNTCFMITTEFPGQTINESQKQAYLYRFRRYMSQHPQY